MNAYLLKKHHAEIESNEIEILWLNGKAEQGKPYDFILRHLPSKTTTYIEVKSTLSADRELIPITFNELQYCCTLSDSHEHFEIFRVYNTGRLDKVHLRIVKHVEEKLRRHMLELFVLI